jgi:imidazolonepropionase-like amidohydrolase
MQFQRILAAATGLFLGLALLSPRAEAADKLAIKAGRVITQAGPEIQDGVIVIEGGRIQAVGAAADVEIPWDAEVLDAPDKVAFPGFVEAHTTRGMDRPNENVDVVPFLSVRDSIDPVNFYFESALRAGITTIDVQQGDDTVIAAQGMVVKPYGLTVEEMLVRPDAGIKLSASPKSGKSRATQAQALRRAFGDLHRYLVDLVQDKKQGDDHARREALYQGRDLETEENKTGRPFSSSAAWTVEGLETVPRGEIDEKQEPLLDLVEGRIPAWFHCERPMDVALALEIASENGFLHRTTLVLESPCWKAADLIAERGVPVVLLPSLVDRERDPVTGEEIETFVPKVFAEKKIPFALASDRAENRPLWFQAAYAVGLGLDRQAALDAVTTAPAGMLRLGDRVGSLETGKDGNVVLFSGDPLSITSFVDYVVIEGKVVYDRTKDVREHYLLEGVRPENTSAAAGNGDEGDGEAAADDHEDKDKGKDGD